MKKTDNYKKLNIRSSRAASVRFTAITLAFALAVCMLTVPADPAYAQSPVSDKSTVSDRSAATAFPDGEQEAEQTLQLHGEQLDSAYAGSVSADKGEEWDVITEDAQGQQSEAGSFGNADSGRDPLMMYMEQQTLGGDKADADTDADAVSVSSGGISIESSDRGAKLSGNNKKIYKALIPYIKEIASGSRKQTVISIPLKKITGKLKFTASDLGVSSITTKSGALRSSAVKAFQKKYDFDLGKIHSSLLADMPYELYWYDKSYKRYVDGEWKAGAFSYSLKDITGQLAYSWTDKYIRFTYDPVLTFSFTVSKDYSASNKAGTYYVRADISKVKTAVSNAQAIAAKYADATDIEKLNGFREEICALTSYDYAYSTKDYGDPWQIIYVFDGDNSTGVVCEGYAKAFQYLCDISDFNSGEIKCRIVTGMLNKDTSIGHMWNILHMNDGLNHMVDITNCDSGAAGAPDLVFLKKYAARSSGGTYAYAVSGTNLLYDYTDNTRAVYSSSELAMAAKDYVCPHNTAELDDGTVTSDSSASDGESAVADAANPDGTDPETGADHVGGAVLTFKCRVCGVEIYREYASAEEAERARYEILAEKYTPAKLSVKSAGGGSKKATVKWKRLSADITGYQLRLTNTKTGKARTVNVKQSSKSTIRKTVTGLKKGKYKIKLRAYKKASGYEFCGKWSAVRKVTVK